MDAVPSGALTFLVTDIEGSVELWERHEGEMSDALARHDRLLRGLIQQHGGQVVKGSGDGIWSVFEHAGMALDAAVSMQSALRATSWGGLGELRVRIALHTGDAEPRDGDYFGQTPNRVARLIELARGGQILASAATIRAAGAAGSASFDLRPLGDLRLRNLREPLGAFLLVLPGGAPADDRGLRSSPSFVPSYPFPTPSRLIGRDDELARLESVLARGKISGQVALIGAPAGTGKSALVGALVRRAQEAGVLCLAGGAYEQAGILPLGPARDALADYLLEQPPESVRDLLGDVLNDLVLVVPELAYHLGRPERPEHRPGQDSERLFGAIYACLRLLTERQPTLLCFEDLHAADDGTIALVQFLVRRARRLPLVVVGTYRTEDVPPGRDLARLLDAAGRQGIEQVDLAPLDLDQTGRLIATLLDGRPNGRLRDALYSTTEGNPLFLEQSVLALREEGRLDRYGIVMGGMDDVRQTLPEAVRGVLERRLSRLSPRCQATVAMAAVIGRTIDHDLLFAALTPVPGLEIVEDVEEAIQARILHEIPAGYAFTHTLLRAAHYESLSVPRRMLLHAQAGEALERLLGGRVAERPAELAHHFMLAGHAPSLRARALRYSLEAGRRAAALSLHREAHEHFSQACDLIDRRDLEVAPDTQLDAFEGRAGAEWALGLWLPLVDTCERVLALAHAPLRRARARGWIGHARQRTGDSASAVRECDAALAELDGAPPQSDVDAARVRLLTDKAYLFFLHGRFREQAALSTEMLTLAERLGQPKPLQWAHNVRALAAMGRGQVDLAIEHFEQFLAAARTSNDRLDQAMAHSNLGIQLQYAGQLGRARTELERAITLCYDAAAEHRAINTMQRLGWVFLGLGDLDAATRQAEQARELASRAGDRWAADCHDLLGSIHTLRAEWEVAAGYFEQARRLREHGPHVVGRVETLLGLGQVRLYTGDWPAARELFEEALATAGSIDPSPWLVAAQRQLGRLLCLCGEVEGPRLVGAALELAETMPRSIEYGSTLLAAATCGLLRETPSGAIPVLRRALASGLTADVRIEVLSALAAIEAEQGSQSSAISHLGAARSLATSLGAPRLRCVVLSTAGVVAAAGGDDGEAAMSFEAALACARAAGLPYEQAGALTMLAERADLEPVRSAALLAEARAIESRLGAVGAGAEPASPTG